MWQLFKSVVLFAVVLNLSLPAIVRVTMWLLGGVVDIWQAYLPLSLCVVGLICSK